MSEAIKVKVVRNGVPMICTSKEQLELFTKAGYKAVKSKSDKPEPDKAAKNDKVAPVQPSEQAKEADK